MEEELCLVDSATTNTILREIKYFQTLKRSKGNFTQIACCDIVIIGFDQITLNFPMDTKLSIKVILLYPKLTRTH